MNQKYYYVYGHYDNGELVYVGKGQGGRLLSTSSRHNKHHSSFMYNKINDGDITFAKILHTKLNEQEALELEKEMIVKHQPVYNKKLTHKELDRARKIAMNASRASMKCISTPAGEFESVSEASRYYGVTPGAIWHRIKDKPTEYYYITEPK